eukprot:3580455-Pyramimonas_sp.AAC.1
MTAPVGAQRTPPRGPQAAAIAKIWLHDASPESHLHNQGTADPQKRFWGPQFHAQRVWTT